MMDEPYLMEQVKEQACFVSQDVRADLAAAAKGRRSVHMREFVLPDGVHNLRGYLRVGGCLGRLLGCLAAAAARRLLGLGGWALPLACRCLTLGCLLHVAGQGLRQDAAAAAGCCAISRCSQATPLARLPRPGSSC
jgi:hypothetical protein